VPDFDITPVIDIAQQAAGAERLEPGAVYAFTTRNGVERLDLTGDQYKGAPSRKQGTTVVRDVPSFLTYWAKHSDANSEVYGDAEKLTVTAVLDAHTAEAARWSQHVLLLTLRRTDAWQQWMATDGKLLPQEQFAEFIEDHLPELLEPSAATMLEVAQSISASTKADFQSGTRLASGERQFKFVETVNAKAGQRGEITIPETFVVGLVPFEGSEGYRLTARLRYRIQDTRLVIGYKLDRPADILRTAFGDVRQDVETAIEQPIMAGTPA
jgi:uncharacterized protein YfdQ (DUF2303 family)